MPSWIRIRNLNADPDPDPATQINADPDPKPCFPELLPYSFKFCLFIPYFLLQHIANVLIHIFLFIVVFVLTYSMLFFFVSAHRQRPYPREQEAFRVPVAGLFAPGEALQGAVYARRTYASPHRRKAPQVHGTYATIRIRPRVLPPPPPDLFLSGFHKFVHMRPEQQYYLHQFKYAK